EIIWTSDGGERSRGKELGKVQRSGESPILFQAPWKFIEGKFPQNNWS
ncbi:hypothetical protein IFM89_015556, partial [Coptis chinensis]